nr:hypothetical protein [Tanacetum cinerariifolium]
MDNKKHIINLESFRDMLHICPRVHGQSFVEPPFEEEILAFIRFLGHSAVIRNLTDVNINKLYQPWRSFAAIINKCLTGKSYGYDSLRLSQAQILWGLYHKRNVDYAYLMWEDFVYHVKHKDHKKSNEMYYPRFTKVIIHHFMSKDPSIPRRNKFDALLPIDLTNEEIKNYNTYKEYYVVAIGAAPPKPKASVWKTQSSSDTIITPPTAAAGPRLTTSQKGKQAAKATKAKNKGTGSIPGVLDVPTDESEKELYWNSTEDEGDDEGKDGDGDDDDNGDDGEEGDDGDHDQEVKRDDDKEGGDDEQEYDKDEYDEETRDKESSDPIPKTPENIDDKGNDEEDLGLYVGREEGHDEEEEEDELYRDVNINQGRGIQATLEVEDSHVTLTPVNPDDAQTPTSVAPLLMTAPTMTPSTIATITTISQASILPTTALSTIIQDLPNFGSLFGFDNRLRTLEANFSEFMQTNQFAGAVSAILGIVYRYMDQRMNEAVHVAVQLQSDKLREEAQKENDEFLKTIDENMQKNIKEQVKEQVKTSYVVAADLFEMELKKIFIEKMEGNKSIQHSDEQRNLYKALVEAYESDKIILDTYGKTVTLKRCHDGDADKDEEPSAGPDRGSKRRREGKEHESASAPMETATRSAGRSTQWTKSRQVSASESAIAEEPMQTTFQMEEPSHPEFDTGTKDQPFVQSSQHPEWFSQQQKPPSLDRDWNKTMLATHESIQPCLKPQVYYFCNKDEGSRLRAYQSARDVYSKRRIIAITKLKIVEWHNYKHLDWITVQRDNDKFYKFKEGTFKRLRIQDVEDMLLLLVQGKLTNLTVKERFAFNVSLRMFTRSIVIQRRVEDLQLGVESYQKKLNLTKSDTDGTLIDVRTALDDRLKGIRMQYLPQSIWRKSDKDRAASMIQAIDKRLKTRRIMRSLKRFVGGRLYEGDFKML